MTTYKQIRLKSTPLDIPEESNFEVVEESMPTPSAGQVLIKVDYLSLDPYMRGQIAGRHISGKVSPGDLLKGETVGTVIASESDKFSVGDTVLGFGGWQEYACLDEAEVNLLRADIKPSSYAISLLGMPGLTAYAGLVWQAQIKPEDTVLIPAAIGAVGSTAAQIAKSRGCKIIGITSSKEKIKYAIDTLGYDACINRSEGKVEEELQRLAPNGVNVYFDLVGGEVLDIASRNLAIGARVILCGLMADYNHEEKTPGPYPGSWIGARAVIHGLVVYDFMPRQGEFLDTMIPLIESGKMHMQEDVSMGVESAPAAFCKLMRGENHGKSLVKMNTE